MCTIITSPLNLYVLTRACSKIASQPGHVVKMNLSVYIIVFYSIVPIFLLDVLIDIMLCSYSMCNQPS